METKSCQNCKKDFIIEPDDFLFYEKMKVPPPTFCPECRMQRRLAWRNEHNLHRRVCDATGKNIITIYPDQSKFPVYDREYWWSDAWDQNISGVEYDFSKPFFEQFKELIDRAPRPNLLQTNVVNGEYSNYILDSKNVYMVFSIINNENTMYCIGSVTCAKDSLDLHLSNKIENSYWLVQCEQCFNMKFAWHCDSCLDSSFLIDCRNCNNCFCCAGLNNKSYCIFNKQYSKEEYQKVLSTYDLGSYTSLQSINKKFHEFALTAPFRYARIYKSVDCTGDDILNAKNCQQCFYIKNKVEDCKHSYRVLNGVRDTMDLTLVWNNMERVYESLSITNGSNVFFSSLCWGAQDMWYCDNCFNSKHLFGCTGLKNAQYCILNKQYTKEEYNALLPKIIEQMKIVPYVDQKGREYRFGEFFPIELSPFPYNEALCQQYFTLKAEEIKENGFTYSESEKRNYNITIPTEKLIDTIKDIPESIVNEIIECAHKAACTDNCQTAFRVVPDELAFYKKHDIPLPRLCLNCRHQARVKKRNPLKLWHRSCMCGSTGSPQVTTDHGHHGRCPNEFETSYSPDRPEIVYCEKCYQQEVV